ncbi:MAG: ion transporter, partial [Actinomycetota bacterium]|nr:ion transporter [Actinomycetota bacterium]
MTDTTPAARPGRLATLVDSDRFNLAISGVIIINAIILGLETFPALMESYESTLVLLNEICYGIFLVELALRLASYGRRPQDFFKSPWNVFDFIII